jgi:acetylornithine deacetylase/succinyl-diaminopimelate desuccinylase family protein
VSDGYRSLALKILRDMIAIPSVNPPGGEQTAAEYVVRTLSAYGIPARVEYVAEGRANAVAELGQGENTLVLNGHLDVVGAGEGWDTPPFSAQERSGRLYGRGACDMKGGIAAMIAAALRAKDEGLPDGLRLVLAFTCDEEKDALGTKRFIRDFEPGARCMAVIGEPTELQINLAHRGVARFRVKVYGRQCHSGRPEQGTNAITALARIIMRLEDFNAERQRITHPVLPSPTAVCTLIQGGIKENVIPGYAECTYDCRTIPGDTIDAVTARARDYVASTPGLAPDIRWELEPFIEVLPSETSASSRIVGIAEHAYEAVFGERPAARDFFGCCDMPFFTSVGIETILMGPGCMDQAHVCNEYVDIEQIYRAADIYYGIIMMAAKA